jgi:hypothetical protein
VLGDVCALEDETDHINYPPRLDLRRNPIRPLQGDLRFYIPMPAPPSNIGGETTNCATFTSHRYDAMIGRSDIMTKTATLTIQRWGNSLAVRIPAAVARAAHF